MKRVLMTLLMTVIIMSSGCKKAQETVIITVNDSPIMKQEVDEIIAKQMSSPFLAQLDKNSDEAKLIMLVAKDKAVNELIVKKIINNEIAKRNITVSNEELDKYKADMIEQIGGEENLQKILEQNKMSENDFNSMVANDIQISKLIDTISPVKVLDADVKKFYAENKASKFTYPDSVRASHILIKDKAKAQEVLAKAKAENADFAALAKQYSEDTGSAQKGGDLGFFSKDEMVKPFADAAFSLKPDTVSDLVESEFGYHIIKVVDRKKAGVMPFDEVKNEIKKYLEDEKKVQALQKFIEGQKSQIKVIYVDESYDPENIKKEVQQYSAKDAIAPQPTEIPAETQEENQ